MSLSKNGKSLPITLYYFSGEISSSYYLENDCYVPARMVDRIDKVTSSIIENGFYQFYASKIDFDFNLRIRRNDINNNILQGNNINDDLQPLTFEQMRIPIMFLLYMMGISVVVFIGEISYFKWKDRRLRKIFLNKNIAEHTDVQNCISLNTSIFFSGRRVMPILPMERSDLNIEIQRNHQSEVVERTKSAPF